MGHAGGTLIHNGKALAATVVFIATGALIRNAQDQTGEHKRHNNRRAAVANKRQRLARHGKHIENAQRVDQKLHRKDDRGTRCHKCSATVGRLLGNTKRRVDQHREHQEEQHGSDKANFLADNSQDVVVMRLGQIRVLHGGVTDTATEQAARGKRHNGKRGLIAITIFVCPRIPSNLDTRHTIRLGDKGDRNDGDAGNDRPNDIFGVQSRKQRHAHEGQQDDQNGAKIGLNKNQKERNAQVDTHLAKKLVDVAAGRKDAVEHDCRIRDGERL